MNHWIEDIRLKLSEGYKGIIISFLIVLFLTYNFIWAIIEPMNLTENTSIKEYKISIIRTHILLAITLTFLITLYIFRTLRIHLEKLSLNPGDENLKDKWNLTQGNVSSTILNDGNLGRIVRFAGNNYALDYDVKPSSYKAKRIEYLVKPNQDFVIYLHLDLKPNQGTQTDDKWIALVLNSAAPEPHGRGNKEWSLPVKANNLRGGWIRYSVDINDAVKKTFGTSGWKFFSLKGLRIRGNAEIAQITIH